MQMEIDIDMNMGLGIHATLHHYLHLSRDKNSKMMIEKLSLLDEMSKNVTDQSLTLVSRQDVGISLEMKRAQDVDDDISSALTSANQAALYLSRARGTKSGGGSRTGMGVEMELDLGDRGGVLGGIYVMEEANTQLIHGGLR